MLSANNYSPMPPPPHLRGDACRGGRGDMGGKGGIEKGGVLYKIPQMFLHLNIK